MGPIHPERAILASRGGGKLYVDSVKNFRARTVPLVDELVPIIDELVPIIDRWAAGKAPDDWLFAAPAGGPLRESNWKRSVQWTKAVAPRLGSPVYGFMTSGILPRRSGWPRVPTRKWFSGCSGMPPRR